MLSKRNRKASQTSEYRSRAAMYSLTVYACKDSVWGCNVAMRPKRLALSCIFAQPPFAALEPLLVAGLTAAAELWIATAAPLANHSSSLGALGTEHSNRTFSSKSCDVSIWCFISSNTCNTASLTADEWPPTSTCSTRRRCTSSISCCLAFGTSVMPKRLTKAGQVVALTNRVRQATPPTMNKIRCASCSEMAPPARSEDTWIAKASPTAPRRPPQLITMPSFQPTGCRSEWSTFRAGSEPSTKMTRMTTRAI